MRAVISAALGTVALGLLASAMVFAQPTANPSVPGQVAPSASNADAANRPAKAAPQPVRPLTEPTWDKLTADQRTALKPLAADWPTMSVPQKRKWMELAVGFAGLPPVDQAKVHARMAGWVALSPQQRAHARINFANASNDLSAEERKAKWQQYQALPPEERQRLRAAGKAEQPRSVALAPRPVASDRLAAVPRATPSSAVASAPMGASAASPGKSRPKIAVAAQPSATPTNVQ